MNDLIALPGALAPVMASMDPRYLSFESFRATRPASKQGPLYPIDSFKGLFDPQKRIHGEFSALPPKTPEQLVRNRAKRRSERIIVTQTIQAFPTPQLSDALATRLSVLKTTASKVSSWLQADWITSIHKQLDYIMTEDAWDDDDALPLAESFLGLLRLIIHLRPSIKPSIGFSHVGYATATWRDAELLLFLELQNEALVRWAVSFNPGLQRNTAAGVSQLDGLKPWLEASGAKKWFAYDGYSTAR